MRAAKYAILMLGGLSMFLSGCLSYDPADLEENQEALDQPVWILFVIDGSQSMAVADPFPEGRVRATREILNNLISLPSVEFGLIRFDGQATALTTWGGDNMLFTNKVEELFEALGVLGRTSGSTNYEAALLMVERALESQMELEDFQAPLPAIYHVIFLTDGLPFPTDAENNFNTPDRIRDLVGRIAGLGDKYEVTSLKMHFAYLVADAPASVQIPSSTLLRDLAIKGGGQYLEFQSGADIDFSSIDFY